jgi:hypothetical protein
MKFVLILIVAVYVLAVLVQLRGYMTSINKTNTEVDKFDADVSFMTPQKNV